MVKDKRFYKTLFTIALPVAAQSLLALLVNMVDNLMVGNLGELALSAVSVANIITVFMSFIVRGLTGGSSLMISQYWGKRDIVRIKQIFAIILRIAFCIGTGVLLLLTTMPKGAMHIFTNDADIIREGSTYLRIVCVSYLFYLMTDSMAGMLRCVESIRITLIITVVSLFTNIGFNYILIYGKLGLPAMGIRGAALATVIARAIEFLITLIYVLKVDKRLQLKLRELFGWNREMAKDYVKYGLPILLGDLQWGLITTLKGIVTGRMGQTMISANSIADVVLNLGQAFNSGLAAGACVVIGKSVGERDYEKTRSYSGTIQLIFACVGLCLGGIVFALSRVVPSFYNVADSTKELATTFIRLGALYIIPATYHIACFTGINRGAGDSRFVFKVDIVCGWCVVIPFTFLVGLVFRNSIPDTVLFPLVFFATRCDQYFKWIVAAIRLHGNRWITNVTRN